MARKPREKKKTGIIAEFKAFINRGNVIDLAVGVIIGGAFSAIVTALTSQIFTPLINWALSAAGGKGALENARTILGETYYVTAGDPSSGVDWAATNYIDWGAFISAVINFLLIAVILFVIVKMINTADKKKKELEAKQLEAYYQEHPEERPAPVEPAAPVPTELDVLNEIRDILKEQKKK